MSAPTGLQTYTKMSGIFSTFYAFLCIILACNIDRSQAEKDFFSLSATGIRGNEVSFELFRGKPTLVVNVASACGYTNQHYSELAWIYEHSDFKDKINILAFPCNQFGAQEPGTLVAIEKLARDVFGAQFPMFTKIDTIGENAHPVYKFLAEATGKAPTWNFWKYLIDADGKVLHAWGPKVTVLDVYSQLYKQVKNTKYEKKEDGDATNKPEESKDDKDDDGEVEVEDEEEVVEEQEVDDDAGDVPRKDAKEEL